jgi:hypothetical protein
MPLSPEEQAEFQGLQGEFGGQQTQKGLSTSEMLEFAKLQNEFGPAKQPPTMPNTSPQGTDSQTAQISGSGRLNNPVINAAEKFVGVATPAGAIDSLVTNDKPFGVPGNRLGPTVQTGLNVASLGLSALPATGLLGGTSDAALKGLAGASLGAGAGAALPGLASSGAKSAGFPGVAKAIDNPIVQLASTMAGGLAGAKMGAPSIPVEQLPDTAYGQLTPAQMQIKSGVKGLTPEIEREAMNRNSNPIQAMARNQADSMQGNLQNTLSKVAPVQEPTTAAANFQTKFGNAQDAAGGAMSVLDKNIDLADKMGATNINPLAVRRDVIQAVRQAGWNIDDAGNIAASKSAKGFSQPVADVLQGYIDDINNIGNVTGLRNLRQNLGQELYAASQKSGVPSSGVKNAVYAALSKNEQAALPPAIGDMLKKQNSIYSGLKDSSDALAVPLTKDPNKFWDSMIGAGNSDKEFMGNVQDFMKKTGMGTGDLKSVAVSNIMDKVKTALNNPAKDDIGRLTQGINSLEKEVNRIPANARGPLLGDAYPQIQQMISDGGTIREWANKLPQNSQTAVLGASHGLNWLANGVEGLSSHIPVVGNAIGGVLGSAIRKGGSVANDAAMNNYLQGQRTINPKVMGLPPWLAGIGIGAGRGMTAPATP